MAGCLFIALTLYGTLPLILDYYRWIIEKLNTLLTEILQQAAGSLPY